MALIIAGERSGVGKTTVTLAILSFLTRKGDRVQSFKVGPDYIDPMFHTAITGRSCRNLDPILTSQSYVRSCFNEHSQGVDYTLIEGVMGLFDGVRYEIERNDYASTAHLARLLNIPVILVIDCSRLSGSVAAIAQGYSTLDPRVKLAGVILNKVGGDRHLELLKEALQPLQIRILGVLRRQDLITIPDRHLGLVPTAELPHLHQLFAQLANLAQIGFAWEHLLPLLETAQTHSARVFQPSPISFPLKIAVPQDLAFSFYYQDNLDILKQGGAEILFWSPINDRTLPEDIQGLYFGGGFPEMSASYLAENTSMRQCIAKAILTGMPTYAECGGLMYLGEQLIDFEDKAWPMVGVIPTSTRMGKNLTLGYRQATALKDSSSVKKGDRLWGHEFHRSQVTSAPKSALFSLRGLGRNDQPVAEGWTRNNLHASYLHVHFGGYPAFVPRFLQHCLDFSKRVS